MRIDLRVARLAKKLTDAVLAEVRGASVGELVAAVASRPSAERSRVPSRATKRDGAKRSGARRRRREDR